MGDNRQRVCELLGCQDFHVECCNEWTKELDEAEARGRASVQSQLDEAVGLLRRYDKMTPVTHVQVLIDARDWLVRYDAERGGT